MIGRYSLVEPLPWGAGPTVPDPQDGVVVDEDECGPCDRRKAHHQCRDFVRYGACCCGTLERAT